MKCEYCGYETHPGDQVCINCGESLSLAHSIIPGIDKITEKKIKEEKKQNRIFLFLCIGGVIIFIAFIVTILLLWLRR